MTNLEWIEYYRFHLSEFDAFIKFCEGLATEVEAWQNAATVREQAYRKLEAQNAKLREFVKLVADPNNWIEQNGETVWNNSQGNEFITEHISDLASELLETK